VSAVLGGSLLYLSGQIYIGNIFTIYSYAIQLSGELRSIIEADIILNHAIASFERINELLNIIDGHTNTSKRTVEQVRSIEAKSLDFSYENNNILNQLSFSAARNEIIGVKGANGTGKSTLLNLICGINKSPKLSINSEPMTNLSEASLLGQISYVPQETFLFPVSIMDNLTCFNRIDKDKVYSVCKSLGIHDRLEKMPMGYETTINEKNSNLSLGERQLVSIARALLKPCDILILDEFNSALDSKIEERLIHSMKPFLKDKIVFIVSHKPNIFDICDKVLDLDS